MTKSKLVKTLFKILAGKMTSHTARLIIWEFIKSRLRASARKTSVIRGSA